MNKSLYGAWISPKDEFIPVEEECHAEKAMQILQAKHETKKYSIYRVMYRLGYVRVIFMSDNMPSVEFWDKLQPTKYQRDFIKDSDHQCPINIYYH